MVLGRNKVRSTRDERIGLTQNPLSRWGGGSREKGVTEVDEAKYGLMLSWSV